MRPVVNVAAFRDAILPWYVACHRAMPWRAKPGELADGYAVLVSETMLQQTQVATVIDYFHRFMKNFPTLSALAAASEQDVLRQWQGLGYYRRATNLHRAARQIVNEHHGCIPTSVEHLLELPGVGRYTAGAIASLAFGVAAPVVDGNVARVLGRVLGIRRIDAPGAMDRCWHAMTDLVQSPIQPRGLSQVLKPGDINQAVMELGATICTPRSPMCAQCPVRQCCVAGQSSRPTAYALKGKRAVAMKVQHAVVAVQRGDAWLFEQRPTTGLWAGMWQMPTLEIAGGKTVQTTDVHALALWLAQRFGLHVTDPISIGTFSHLTTHRHIDFHVYKTFAVAGRTKRGSGRWQKLSAIADLPISNAQKKVLKRLNT